MDKTNAFNAMMGIILNTNQNCVSR